MGNIIRIKEKHILQNSIFILKGTLNTLKNDISSYISFDLYEDSLSLVKEREKDFVHRLSMHEKYISENKISDKEINKMIREIHNLLD